MRTEIVSPPRTRNHLGEKRRIGVELEFAAVSPRDAALRVQRAFGGTAAEIDRHRWAVSGSDLGDFTIELDWSLVHRDGETDETGEASVLEEFKNAFQGILGDLGATVMPCEIVSPPIEIADIARIDDMLDGLAEIGARGTHEHPLYAFGTQLNPDIAERDADYIVAVLKAYLLLSDWLRRDISLDPTRRLLTFANPFPAEYVLRVVDPDYWPDQASMIDEYLAYSPTRNRELDMLPLFSWLDEDRVRRAVRDRRIKSRPTFHYRLPDSRIGQSDWSVAREWNRWCAVEWLAERRDDLREMAAEYAGMRTAFATEEWAAASGRWVSRVFGERPA